GGRTQVGGVAKHFRQGHLDIDHLAGDTLVHAENDTAAAVEIPHHIAHVFFGGNHLHLHDRLQQHGAAKLGQLLCGHGGSDLERHLVGVHIVVGAVIDGSLEAKQRVTSEHAVLHLLCNTFLDGRNVFLGDHPTHHFVDEFETFRTLIVGRGEADPAVAVLAATTGL